MNRPPTDPESLARGTPRQRDAARALDKAGVFDVLAPYGPVVSGTVPLALDVADSDIDVLCEAYDCAQFAADAARGFACFEGFAATPLRERQGVLSATVRFVCAGFAFEIFAQALPVARQRAYRHMMIEARLLAQKSGAALRDAVMARRDGGMKTEPAFAHALGLTGDPYAALLALESEPDAALGALVTRRSGRGGRR